MQPPYTITSKILELITGVSHKTGEVNALLLTKVSPALRKKNRIRTIQASLSVEGNTLSVEQITAIIDNKKVLGPAKDIKEVSNAIRVYDQLRTFNPQSEKSFLLAHKILMQGLITSAGKYRNSGVGIVKGGKMKHMAPPAQNVPFLMKELFNYLKKGEDLALIKSCIFHYEMEFIHPFSDGNGRMGRLWQTLLLMQQYPLFEYLPFETLISKNQKNYYKALSISDKRGESTVFIAFMLQIISNSLDELLNTRTGPISFSNRIQLFIASGIKEFTRKDYMMYYKTLSSATASRDLKIAAVQKLIKKTGDKNKTVYKVL
ncbi:MAG: Fic family protein [Chitinophagaceae bacterium]|nr:Fic family protein [Chitinophagaceae bacterium]